MTTAQEHIPLAPLTTIRLGGSARYFVRCHDEDALRAALLFARHKDIPVHILGGGSNTVFADAGFDGLVIQIALGGTRFDDTGVVTAAAGEVWDTFVVSAIERDFAGIECLSGIPGLVGAAPMQNIGAYGQRASEVITSVSALDRETLDAVSFSADACEFAYRQSRFKQRDAGRFVITAVTFQLRPHDVPHIAYPELAAAVSSAPSLSQVREAVLGLRSRKSMVVNPDDPNTVSCGSFFTNPVLQADEFAALCNRFASSRGAGTVPSFPEEAGIKVPAGWLVEQAGFSKGLRRGGVGISENHALALVNFGGTASELLALADEITRAVYQKFGVTLVREPVVVP